MGGAPGPGLLQRGRAQLVRRYRDVDGEFYALVLTAFFFVTLLPAALVLDAYASASPHAAADTTIRRLGLSGATADLVRGVLVGAGGHKLQATLIAVFSVVIFGLGIGRALQLVYARAWGLAPRGHMVWDQLRYLAWFLAFLGLIVLFALQVAFLPATWIQWVLAPVWALVIVAVLRLDRPLPAPSSREREGRASGRDTRRPSACSPCACCRRLCSRTGSTGTRPTTADWA